MAGAVNTFEGGTDATTITTGNSGGLSGDAFSAASNVTFSTVRAAHGSLSGRTAVSVTGTVEHAMSGNGVRYARAYVWASGVCTALELTMPVGTGTNAYSLDFEGTTVKLYSYVNGSVFTLQSQTTTLFNQWIRVELSGTSLAAGTATARIYAGDAIDPLFTLTGSTSRTATTWTRAAYGGFNGSGGDRWIDTVGWSDVDWLGSAAPPGVPMAIRPTPQAVQRASRW